MTTLYRQYRPGRFAQVSGQDHIIMTLKNALASQRIAHAYLFHGPRGVGKTTTARILAQRLNCQKPEGAEPCGTCATCVAAQENRLLDTIEIDAASNRGIDDIRALQEGIGLSPSLGTHKVFIIDEVHMLTKEAFTALLKTLEEPAAHVVFILASTEFHKIPETIISRCQVFHFRRATTSSMQERLRYLLQQEKRSVEDEALDFIIQRSDGCYRDAESLLGQALSLQEGAVRYEDIASFLGLPPHELLNQWLTALVRGDATAALAAVDQVFTLGFDAEHFIQESIRAARDGVVWLIKNETTATKYTFHQTAGAREALPRIIRTLVQAMQDVAFVPEPAIALQIVIVTLCTSERPTSSPPSSPPRAASTKKATPATTPTESTKPSPPAPAAPVTTPVKQTSSATASDLQLVTAVWPQLIDRIKHQNPVASTFLRAVKPMSYRDGVVQIEARYSLHKSFFDKPENQRLVNATLSELLNTPVVARCIVQETTRSATTSGELKQQEQALLSAVQEVFGK